MALPVRVHRDKTDPARWDGFAELRRLADGPDGFLAPRTGTELREPDDAYVVKLAVPHMKKRDIDVSVAGRRLIIMGEHTQRSGILRRRTRRVEQLRYHVVLPGQVVEDGVRANLDGDVLTEMAARDPQFTIEPESVLGPIGDVVAKLTTSDADNRIRLGNAAAVTFDVNGSAAPVGDGAPSPSTVVFTT